MKKQDPLYKTALFTYLQRALYESMPFIIPMGLLYAIGIPINYFIYIRSDSIWLDALSTLIAIIVLLCRFNLLFNKKHLMVYWLLFLIINFPLMFTYNLLINPDLITYKLAMMIMLLAFFPMLTDVILLAIILLIGILVAYLLFSLETQHWFIPVNIRSELPVYILGVIFGLILSFNRGKKYKQRLQIMHLFVEQLNHELRTPLTKIEWSLKNVITAIPNCDQKAITAAKEISTEIIRSTEVMQTLSAASFALNEQKEINYPQISMYECIEEAIIRYPYRNTFNVKNVIWHESHDFYFQGSRVLMVQILFNLLSNSIYATKDVQQPRIEIYNTSDRKYHCVLFKDNGIGIKNAMQKSIFKPLFTTKKEGKGLGLYFCREIIRKFGGDIQCQSEWGKSTTFIIKFAKNGRT